VYVGNVATPVPTRAENPELTTPTENGAAAFTVTAPVCVMPTAFAVAEIVLPCAAVELKVVVKTPLPMVVPDEGLNVLPEPLDAGVTVAPLMRLLNWSRTVIVIVDAVVPALHDVEHAVIDAVPTASDDCDALTPAGLTVTPAVCVIAPPPSPVVAVAEMVFASATVELSFAA
jgi:hypothetical protein